MEAFEMVAMVAALALMFGAVGAKVATTQLLSGMNHQVSHIAQAKQEVLGRLKAAQSQKAIIERNKQQTATKKSKIEKKMSRLKKELTELKGSDELRKQRTGICKVE
jgi:septal ring factor EnvC (AmiA/AmiB activator)